MKKRVNIAGLRWSIQELVGIFVGAVVTILLLNYLATKLEYGYFLSTAAIIVTTIAGLIGALSLKRMIDTVRPFLAPTKTELLLGESPQKGAIKLSIRNTGPTPAEGICIRLSISKLRSKAEEMSLQVMTPTIFPTEERVITCYPSPELLSLIEAEQVKLALNITYQSAQKKYYTARTMWIVKGRELNGGNSPFDFEGIEDTWN